MAILPQLSSPVNDRFRVRVRAMVRVGVRVKVRVGGATNSKALTLSV